MNTQRLKRMLRDLVRRVRRVPPPYSPVRKMVADSRTMLVVCYSDPGQRNPVMTLYLRGMCEELGVSPSVMTWGGVSTEPKPVPVWDAPVSERDQLGEVLPRIMRMYSERMGWSVDSHEVQTSRRQ